VRKEAIMREKIEEICRIVLERITPKKDQRAKIEKLAERLEAKVAKVSKEFGVEVEVRLEGSVAKGTWLSEEPDVDIFMRIPKTIPRESLGEICLRIARKATEGAKQIERFAEHPYLEAIVDGVRVNVVPCYNVRKGEWLSATDRTPYHTDYIKSHLDKRRLSEVRLLKKFMKGIDVYGAEIKIGGFSGYLCELIILHFKSFLNALKAFAHHRQRMIVDIENFYEGREDELKLLFQEPFVIVDPVDKGRNVASAVRMQKLFTFTAAARAFLKNPSLEFFYPPETAALEKKKLEKTLKQHGSAFIFITFGKVEAVPDVLWGQLYKSMRSLEKFIQLNGFNILRGKAWSNEKTLNMFIFQLEQRFLSPVKKHLGPPIEKEEDCEKFLIKHLNNSEVVSGPYIEKGRWVVELKRKYTDVVILLNEKLKREGGRKTGIADKISRAIRNDFKILVNNEIADIYAENVEFAKFLTDFLSGKPKWLEAYKGK
jgi:tRNA nucleotidyltransferase (CCA-adding enzyme)